MPLPIRCIRQTTLIAVLVLTTATASAQAFDAVRLYGAAPGQDLAVAGALVLSGPAYLGADKSRTQLLPLVDYQWANGWFAGLSNGLGLNLSDDRSSAFGLRLTADFGRKESRGPALLGMGDVGLKPEIGAFYNATTSSGLFATSSLRFGSGNSGDGLLLDLGAGYSVSLAPLWRMAIGVAATAANAKHLQAYFGVDAPQSLRSGYQVYTPKSGMRDARTNVSLTYAFDPRTAVTAALTARRLLGDASHSPLTQERDAVNAVLVVTYGF